MNELKELPRYFYVKAEKDNPLFRKFINWLNEEYNVNSTGDSYKYYGFAKDKYFWDNSDFITCKPELITLEYWNECINKKEEIDYTIPGTKLPTIPAGTTVVYDGVKTKFINDQLHLESFGHKVIEKEVYILADYRISSDAKHWEIKLSDIKQLTKQDMKQEIISYEVKPEFADAASKLALGGSGRTFMCNAANYHVFKKYGVLDIWFTPVYKAQYSLPNINNHKGKLEGDFIIYGSNCAKFHRTWFAQIMRTSDMSYTVNKDAKGQNRTIKSITLDSGVVITMDEIKQINDFINNQ